MKQFKDRYRVGVSCYHPAVFEHHPDLTSLARLRGAKEIILEYPAIHQCNQRPITFGGAYTEFLGKALGIPLTLQVNRPHLYLTHQDRYEWWPWIQEITGERKPFLMVCNSWKADYPVKKYYTSGWQAVVDAFPDLTFIQIGQQPDNRNASDCAVTRFLKKHVQVIRRMLSDE
jgi:hypothetical protein